LQDPVRTFPSTLGAQLGIIGSAIYAYNNIQGRPRVKVLAGLGALGVLSGMTFYTMAIENPIGFNMYMYSLSEYFNNGKWPNLIGRIDHKELIEQTTEKILSSLNISKAITPTFDEKSLILKALEKLGTDWPKGPSNPSSFIGETNSLVTILLDLFNSISDNLLQMIAVFFRPYPVSGYFDDLLGQQLIIYLSLFSIVSGLILLFIFFTINSLFLIHKDFIIKRFDNRLISFYIRYQAFLANLAMIHLQIFILIGLLVLALLKEDFIF